MDTSLKDAIREAYASAPSKEIDLLTIELNHPAFTQPLRVVRDNETLTARLEDTAPENPGETVDFLPYAFDLELPEMDEYGKLKWMTNDTILDKYLSLQSVKDEKHENMND